MESNLFKYDGLPQEPLHNELRNMARVLLDFRPPVKSRDVRRDRLEIGVASDTDAASAPASAAAEHPLPQTPFYSVEYPGYVRPTSVPLAVSNLGGQSALDNAFRRAASKMETLIELKLRPNQPFAHPVPGDVVPTNNILFKVVKRRRKKRPEGEAGDGAIGEYTAEAVGVIPKTVRFRSMVDYQYQPDMNDPVSKLRVAMDNMDVETIQSYVIPEEKADYMVPVEGSEPETAMDVDYNLDPQLNGKPAPPPPTGDLTPTGPRMRSNLRLFPPPLFSRQTIPQAYNFKSNTASMVSTTIDPETGEERKRLINRMRWKGYGPASIMFTDATVPDKPPQVVEEGRHLIDQNILKKLEDLFVQRPVWTRMSLFNQLAPNETREILNSKALLPLVCYVFQDGPWRDTLVRFSYDPRKDRSARFYQRLYFRNANHPIARPSVTTRRQDRTAANIQLRAMEEGTEKEADRRRSHIFDGQSITKETAAFQLCDITDPMLREMIEDPDELREECHERDGWYTAHAFERIKTVLRHKFFSLLEGHPATDEECRALLASNEGSAKATIATRSYKLRAGKHNMAKGALRPEDAAAMRLRAALDRNAKTMQGLR
ncbi:putative RNA polymerase III transcription factor (TF)IIIC subunit [Lyophyllum shimeji]|uniref:RNA polymerase III transcription factor (TF)IIIC subunit n=1 Tax=Lyophyllum shimeji TaxID=47721 RepID=A0A9P3UHB7_LYOSH|nr:putative RNA polymerase III transcription factor (TF)IIIC subunit [Lyophyllum shimeji]